MSRYTQQFRVVPSESLDHGEIAGLKEAVKDQLGDGLQRIHDSTMDVDVPPEESRAGPMKQVRILMVTVYLDEYYSPRSSPDEWVGENAEDIGEALSPLDVKVSAVANSAAPVPE